MVITETEIRRPQADRPEVLPRRRRLVRDPVRDRAVIKTHNLTNQSMSKVALKALQLKIGMKFGIITRLLKSYFS